MTALFSLPKFQSLAPGWRVEYFDETDSTNTRAMEALSHSSPTIPSLFLAEHQHSGRGRRSKHWLNTKGKDLLFTALIKDQGSIEQCHQIATRCALALARSLQHFELQPKIKLPNDIYLNQRKASGILIERHKGHLLIGIGVNVNSTPYIENSTSLLAELGHPVSRESLLARILLELKQTLQDRDYNHIIKAFQPLDLLFNQALRYTRDNQSHFGIAKGISNNGYMLIDHGDGPIEVTGGHDFRPLVTTSH
ncbi:biotin--[acetyl-CoA-carboxylase] ligase [Rubritalea marina]|uniref:biotin--[acetyl-CoA-carboxylase] ligase n=1 Tax=Rubritalea marina TaxID=361055 RepID=UPI00036E8089|nr:biotin--[acetyl-CoA-carboxylase] ligase [Rubritalea marina]